MPHSLERRLGSQHNPDWPVGCSRVPCVAAGRKLKCGGAGVAKVKLAGGPRIIRASVFCRRLVSSMRTATLARGEGNQPSSPARPPSVVAHRCPLRTAFTVMINSPVLCWCGGSLHFYRLEVDGRGAAKQFGLDRRCHRELANPHRLGKHFSIRQVAMAASPDVPWTHVSPFPTRCPFSVCEGPELSMSLRLGLI
jgi:hypothetical protein